DSLAAVGEMDRAELGDGGAKLARHLVSPEEFSWTKTVIASEAKQSPRPLRLAGRGLLRRSAPRNDGLCFRRSDTSGRPRYCCAAWSFGWRTGVQRRPSRLNRRAHHRPPALQSGG